MKVVVATVLALSLSMLGIPAGAESPDQSKSWGPIDMKSRIVQPGTKEKFTFAA